MKVLVLGSGGREHALVWKLRQAPEVTRVFALPGSDGMGECATCLPGDPCDAATVIDAIAAQQIDLTVVGPEAPLAAGIVDAVRSAGHAIFGPAQAAAQLEASKIFAKDFMVRHRIPTARFAVADNAAQARRALGQFRYPVVIKADGLAAGKGVVIATDAATAEATLEAMLAGAMVGAAGNRILLEECLCGPELSVLAVCDGERAVLLPPARDHKRLLDGDQGPNTGGMGAFSVDALLPEELQQRLEADIVQPVLRGMAAAGTPFQGVLYCGLMLTADGPRVLEFNVRFGDPETQPILMRWRGNLASLLAGAAQGRLPDMAPLGGDAAAACVVAASGGYPGAYAQGEAITGLETPHPDAVVFHAGTRFRGGRWESAGGRVLGVTASAPTLNRALRSCYDALERIHFRGMQYRRDIGAAAIAAQP